MRDTPFKIQTSSANQGQHLGMTKICSRMLDGEEKMKKRTFVSVKQDTDAKPSRTVETFFSHILTLMILQVSHC